MGLLPGFYVPLQMLSHPPLPLFTTFLSTQGRDKLTESYLMWSWPIPKDPNRLGFLHQYPSPQLSVKFSKGLASVVNGLTFVQKCAFRHAVWVQKRQIHIIPLLIATHQQHLSLEKHHKVACVFFDFAKAFESVPHQTLIHQLIIPPALFQWLPNYLSIQVQYWQLQQVRVQVRGGADVLIKTIATYGSRNVN